MKLKLDENLPRRLTAILKNLGHDIHTVQDEGLSGAFDADIWKRTQEESRLFVTQDMDFADLRTFVPGTHCGLLLIRLHTPSWKRLARRIQEIFQAEDVGSWLGCFVVATEAKVRVVRPQKLTDRTH
jgi:predicted nuclease of predicted toxin-antitoxin system